MNSCNQCQSSVQLVDTATCITYGQRRVAQASVQWPDSVEIYAVVRKLTTPFLRCDVRPLMKVLPARMVEEELTSTTIKCADERP